MEKNLHLTNQFAESLGTLLNRGSTVQAVVPSKAGILQHTLPYFACSPGLVWQNHSSGMIKSLNHENATIKFSLVKSS